MKALAILAMVTAVGAANAQFGIQNPSVKWSPFYSSPYGRITKQGFQLIRNQTELEGYWTKATGQAPESVPSGVDWVKDAVVAIHLGERNSGGYRLMVRGVEKNIGGDTVIRVTEQQPRPGSYVTSALTQPWVMIKVDSMVGRVVIDFQRLDERGNEVIGGPVHRGPNGELCSCQCNCACCRR